MKKKIASLLCAAMLLMALPTLAWAAPSPANSDTASDAGTGVSVTVSSDLNTSTGGVDVVATDAIAEGYEPAANGDAFVATFDISTWGDLAGRNDIPVSMTFSVGSQYAGMTARIYVQHNDGSLEETTAIVAADGTVTFSMDRLSYVTIAIEQGQTVASAAAGTAAGTTTGTAVDKSATSPQTGLDLTGVAGAAVIMTAAAGCVAVALRKKVTE